MRDIKFRVWNRKENKMITPKNTDRIDNILTYWETHIKVELMQYSWLTDNNWIEIYEGDIIQIYKPIYKKWSCEIIWDKWIWKYKVIFNTWWFAVRWWWTHNLINCKIIWNIYENPDLI